MVSRHWMGLAHRDRANEYVLHLQHDTFRKIKSINGFKAAHILKREVDEGTEFLIITEWENIDAIKEFAGANFDVAVVPQLVQEIMIRYDDKVRHYDVEFETAAK
ncbi:antibiotic biosynthesis monooxygenase [Fulvivirgaceae bacterium PWU4]|uniref:Antibiotic biosynthesis monooxygenase n=1 Tax=Chryseosolibacter histidini TaxID=2782349 RepID=A0AAP2GLU0_9BACT|nr:antibiotic biosynthesis monooxygenase [Chryseosolibacter histidini]MBT1696203.1 antibiotic biosynthesis monooxygenase [Chryseosolibacter histidini]